MTQTHEPHPTHEDTDADTHRKQWIRYSAAAVGIVVAVLLLFKFVINPWVLQYFMDNPLTESEKREMALLEKYDITSIETSTKTTGYSRMGQHSVTYYVVDGVMRDCEITGPTADPVLTCIGWEPPLRGADAPPAESSLDLPSSGITIDPPTPTPEVSVTETVIP